MSGNRAISLGGYLWAVSSIKQEQLQVRCLEETHIIEIQPPLQIVYLGNGCEGYSPSMFLPAKNEMTTHAQIESRREYFLQFNYVYTPDRYIGLWWQFRMRMMSEREAGLRHDRFSRTNLRAEVVAASKQIGPYYKS